MKHKLWLLFVATGWTFSANANEHTDLSHWATDRVAIQTTISQALNRYQQASRDKWAYQVSRYENEEGDESTSIERFNPNSSISERWTLIEINGAAPTEEEREDFAAKRRTSKESEDNNLVVSLSDIISLETLTYKSESDEKLNATFDVHLEQLGDDASSKLKGSLVYNKNLKFIEAIDIKNIDKFSPMFGASVSDFLMTFEFQAINQAILPKKNALRMKGTYALFSKFDEVSHDTFSNFTYQGDTLKK
ncbi:hypothetical protein [Veronia pacifica]|uniref:Uncharacterized protein n=1 Tax=Veronia pacifica TaxID=1080227 RepID=A0A1C3ES25_9GAMM|nr:hypothetical protein [Veronia pacifica]ODA36036.1 hypothetical protein A8L45_00020 [Veronia pacifica]